jgi:TP901 family phage tail tape measure protein
VAFTEQGVAAVVKDLKRFVDDLDKMAAATKNSGDKMEASAKKGEAFEKALHKVSLVATAALVGIGAASFKMAADFDAAMTESLAIMGDVSDAMRNEMADAAREMSTQTIFSAKQAADSYFFLASAGLSAEASVAALPAVAKFAQAGMFDMALATDLLTDAQSALGLTVRDDAVKNLENMVKISDILVKANVLANASVQQFSEALTNKAGAAIKILNKDLEEGVSVLAVFADQGLKGAAAGEALDIVFRDLQRAALSNREEWDKLGLSVFDANGKMRPTADIIEDLTTKTDGMSDATFGLTLRTLGFQDRSVKNIKMLLGSSDAMRTYEAALRDAGGITEEVSEKQLQTFNARLKLAKNELSNAAITIGTQFLPAAEAAANGLGAFAGGLEKVNPGVFNLALAFAGVALALPKMIGLVDKAAHGLGLMEKSAHLSAGKMTGLALGIGAVVVGIDLLLRKTTGHGLIETVFGDPARADHLAAAMKEVAAAMDSVGNAADRLILLNRKLAEATDQASAATEVLAKENRKLGVDVFGANDSMKQAEERTRAVAREMVTQRVSTEDLRLAYLDLPPALQEIFDAETNVIAKMREQERSERALEDAALANAKAHKTDLAPAIDETAAAVGRSLPGWIEAIRALEDAEDAAKALDDVIKNLTDTFAANNPVVIAAQTENAILTEELEDLRDKGDKATASEKERIQVLEEAIAQNDRVVKAHEDNSKAIQGTSRAMEQLLGKEGYALFLDRLRATGLAEEELVEIQKKMAGAFVTLEREGIGPARGAIEALHLSLADQPELWAEIAAAIGPRFMDEIDQGIANPDQRAEFGARLVDMGVHGAEGFIAGLGSANAAVRRAAAALAQGAVDEMGVVLKTQSPSKVTEEIGRDVGEGLIFGIENMADELAQVVDNVTSIIGRGLAEAAQYILDQNVLGNAGARVMENLREAIITGSVKAFDSMGRGLGQILAQAQEKLDPVLYAPLMERVMDALNEVIATGGRAGIETLRSALADMHVAMEEGTTKIVNLLGVFDSQMALVLQDIVNNKRWGTAGADLIEQLRRGIEEGDPRAVQQAANTALRITEKLEKELGPDQAQRLSAALISALRTAIEQGGEEALKALEAVLDQIAQATGTGTGGAAGAGGTAGTGSPMTPVAPPAAGTKSVLGEAQVSGQTLEYVKTAGGTKTPVARDGTLLHSWIEPMSPDEIKKVAGWPEHMGPTHAIPGWTSYYAAGTSRVPRTGPAFLHEGEMVLPASIAERIRDWTARADQRMGDLIGRVPFRDLAGAGAVGDTMTTITVDLRGATMTGTLEENERMMRRIMRDEVDSQLRRGAFLGATR